ncbi:RNA polymerase-binding protein RbpA [Carbonactinospora thermoautotrophica]|uniref:RNA polymerase-binding protein RbpA n=2 Tax=Carbonactinospora thermoautotrophica TaxID=1469144 RepID=A0A132NH31_9ACTN|nr:Electron transport protein [Carbonactinospora thermoautotrophica]KWX04392.1 electron transporter [Carbonactinospora thermoautotrophica]KWX09445.1 electron transporter [Carbonactinospora thermoautotrophica]MCX9191113.1 RNA polymerase-binding protein RbpA [Carbonactinospora thermoautotrophica]
MSGGNAIRGTRVGAGPMGEAERGEAAPRIRVSYWCAKGHETRPSFAADAQLPDTWDCPRCGWPASRNRDEPPAPPKTEPYKTHLAYVRERRTPEEGEAILAEALAKLRAGQLGRF